MYEEAVGGGVDTQVGNGLIVAETPYLTLFKRHAADSEVLTVFGLGRSKNHLRRNTGLALAPVLLKKRVRSVHRIWFLPFPELEYQDTTNMVEVRDRQKDMCAKFVPLKSSKSNFILINKRL